jgi:hypothetical protein
VTHPQPVTIVDVHDDDWLVEAVACPIDAGPDCEACQ